MNPPIVTPLPEPIVYPDSDGLPMADNTKQFRWIMTIYGNVAALLLDRSDVFVAGNLLWYPVEGRPDIRISPDVFVAFGRPKGDRGSYKQWEEGGIAPAVAFEVLSPGNTPAEMREKLVSYEERGVEEYYVYDPDSNYLTIHIRNRDVLRRERRVDGFVSPRLGIRFDTAGPELVVSKPDGRPFLTFEQLEAARQQAEAERQQADAARQQAEAALKQLEATLARTKQEAALDRQRNTRLAELARKARRGQASAEELRELEQLEDQSAPPG
jgi:Uma2 family endonuclease